MDSSRPTSEVIGQTLWELTLSLSGPPALARLILLSMSHFFFSLSPFLLLGLPLK